MITIDEVIESFIKQVVRASAAEQRVKELEEQLKQIAQKETVK